MESVSRMHTNVMYIVTSTSTQVIEEKSNIWKWKLEACCFNDNIHTQARRKQHHRPGYSTASYPYPQG